MVFPVNNSNLSPISLKYSSVLPMPVGIAAEAIKGLITLAAVAATEFVIVLFVPGCTEDGDHLNTDASVENDGGIDTHNDGNCLEIFAFSQELQEEMNDLIDQECAESIPQYERLIRDYECYENIVFAQYYLGLCYSSTTNCDEAVETLCPILDNEDLASRIYIPDALNQCATEEYYNLQPLPDPSITCSDTTVEEHSVMPEILCTYNDTRENYPSYNETSQVDCQTRTSSIVIETPPPVDCSTILTESYILHISDIVGQMKFKFFDGIDRIVVYQTGDYVEPGDETEELAFYGDDHVDLRNDFDESGQIGTFRDLDTLTFIIYHEFGHHLDYALTDCSEYYAISGNLDTERFANDFALFSLGAPAWKRMIDNSGDENERSRYSWFQENPFCGRAPQENLTGALQYLEASLMYCGDEQIAAFQKIIDNYLESPAVPDAYIGMATCKIYTDNCSSALNDLQLVKSEYSGINRKDIYNLALAPNGPINFYYPTYYDSYAQYQIGMVYADCLGDLDQAVEELDTVVENYPETPEAFESLYIQGNIYIGQNNCPLAIPAYEKAINDYYDDFFTQYSYFFDVTFFNLGSCYYENGDCEKAISTFEKGGEELLHFYPEAQEMINACQ